MDKNIQLPNLGADETVLTRVVYKGLARIFSMLVILIGVLVLIGWQFDITILKSIFPGIVNMNPLTATSFILLGASLVLFLREKPGEWTIAFMRAVAVFVILVGAIRFLGIIWGIDLRHDQILFHDKIVAMTTFGQNRIAPNTALNFMLIGTALFLLTKHAYYRALQICCFTTTMIALFAILGYAYAVKNLYGFLAYTPMALNTAITFFLTATAINFSVSDKGYMHVLSAPTVGGYVARRLIPIIIFIPSIIGWLRLWGQHKGYYTTEYGTALFIICSVAIFVSIVYWIAVIMDKVDQKRKDAEKRLQAYAMSLEQLDRLKDEFVSMASHELRTPMTAIKGLVSMIFEGDYGKMPENLKSPLTDVSTSTDRMINLVNDLLDLARIEAGRVKFVLGDARIDTLVTHPVSFLQPLTKQKGIVLKSKDIPHVLVQADPDKVQQILNNILGNAIKFTDAGSIIVSGKQKNELVQLYITDTGVGITKEDQAKLFGKFQQVSSQKAGRPAGTGLGLYISRELARKMGGDLWIEKSETGVGTTFGYSIPLAKSNKAATIKEDVEKEARAHPDQK